MHRFRLRETSEKTTEVNTLSDITSLIERISKRKVTIIAPTQRDEADLGFDEIIEDLPSGRIIAFQFKRPYFTPSIPGCSRFYLDTQQLQRLLGNFSRREAYYVFVPYPLNSDFVQNRQHLLNDAIALDVYDVPNAQKVSQQSRTVRYYRNRNVYGNLNNVIRVADPRVYETVQKTNDVIGVCKLLIEGEIGIETPINDDIRRRYDKEKHTHPRKLFYIHLSSERTITS
jgi:hypothetical protein